ncbi:Gfo/Idh/MocA family protein [Planctomycetota bacterium]
MINVAVIGAGHWGRNLVRNFNQVSGAKLYAICDLDEKIRQGMSKLYPEAKIFSDYDKLLADPDLTAVVIASPAPYHYEMGMAALRAGKHAFIEKPLALKGTHAAELCSLAGGNRLKIMVGHLLIYHPAIRKMKELIESGELGDVYCIYTERVNLGIIRDNENAWWSLAPHDISVVLELLQDEPESIVARGEDYLQKGIEDTVFANIRFQDGRMAQIHVSWLDPHKSRKMTVVGSKKMAVFDDMEASEKVRIYDKGAEVEGYVSFGESISIRTGDIIIPKIDGKEPLALECQHFVDCVAGDEKLMSGGQAGLRVTEILEAGQRSLEQGGVPVKIVV